MPPESSCGYCCTRRSGDGRPIALLANYSLHYVGGVPNGHVSADYFGEFARRIAGLLKRYPHVSNKDRKEILDFMKEARHLEIGLLTANDNVLPQLDAFMEDHKRHFRLDLFDVVRAMALIAAIFMICWLLWELFMPVAV